MDKGENEKMIQYCHEFMVKILIFSTPFIQFNIRSFTHLNQIDTLR